MCGVCNCIFVDMYSWGVVELLSCGVMDVCICEVV